MQFNLIAPVFRRLWQRMKRRRPATLARQRRRIAEAGLHAWDCVERPRSIAEPQHAKAGGDAERLAEARARKLLINLLSPAQREELRSRDCFTVHVAGRGQFVVLPRKTLNVLNTETGQCYCCVTETEVPLSDLMLTQKLMLETDPERFFAVANSPSEFLFRQERHIARASTAPFERALLGHRGTDNAR